MRNSKVVILTSLLAGFLATQDLQGSGQPFQECPCLGGGPCLCGLDCPCAHKLIAVLDDNGKGEKPAEAGAKKDKETGPDPTIQYPDEVEPNWWVHKEYGKDILYLWQGNFRCLGYWDHKAGYYVPFKSKKDGSKAWFERKTDVPPLPLPPGYVYTPRVNKPVDPSKPAFPQTVNSDNTDLSAQYFGGPKPSQLSMVDRFTLNGVAMAPRELVGVLEVPDDSRLWHISVLCEDKALRERILKDFKSSPALAPFAGRTRVQAYDPQQKVATIMLAPFKLDRDTTFQRTRFAIYVQPPVGKGGTSEVFPLYTYTGPEELAQFIRKCDPLYNPDNNVRPSPAGDFLTNIPAAAWVLIAGVVLLVVVVISKNPNRALNR
jgi:hypothetical protein